MVIGIGSDLVDIRRIKKTFLRFGDKFIHRIFSEHERERSNKKFDKFSSYAKRFAAKEACSKALGTGFSEGVYWRDMCVVNLENGRPTMVLTGGALEQLKKITPPKTVPTINISLTDESPMAHAVVIITSEPIHGK